MTERDTSEATLAAPAEAAASALPADEIARMTDEIIAALKTVYDPEIPADIYELGLIYKVDIADDRKVTVDMTLTTPNCPSAASPGGTSSGPGSSCPTRSSWRPSCTSAGTRRPGPTPRRTTSTWSRSTRRTRG